MALDLAAAEHACNVVRRQIQEEFPDLSLVFVIYKDDGLGKAFQKKIEEITDHPAGPALLPMLQKAAKIKNPPNRFCGLGRARAKKLLFARNKTIACFFLRLDPAEDAD